MSLSIVGNRFTGVTATSRDQQPREQLQRRLHRAVGRARANPSQARQTRSSALFHRAFRTCTCTCTCVVMSGEAGCFKCPYLPSRTCQVGF